MDIQKIINDGKLYVYDTQEVILTGRKATKRIKNAFIPNGSDVIDVLIEIEPVDPDVNWKKFVRHEELYEITKE